MPGKISVTAFFYLAHASLCHMKEQWDTGYHDLFSLLSQSQHFFPNGHLCTFHSVHLDSIKVAEAPPVAEANCELSEKASTSRMAGSQCG